MSLPDITLFHMLTVKSKSNNILATNMFIISLGTSKYDVDYNQT